LVTGYTAPILYWLKMNDQLPSDVYGTTGPEFFVSRLTDERPVTDPTDALIWGVYDTKKLDWDYILIDALGLDKSLFSSLGESCSVAGRLTDRMAGKLGISASIPVAVASGDHQCSFAGAVGGYLSTVAINVGTSGQTSLYVENPMRHGWLEFRRSSSQVT
ncbi:MAG: FGGY family carbohydrate kinase, partial [Candidatus Poribacteria bacterium]|nr:FGGY family carbohydrate kinase [Candidatus Poribacteria bacterium]